MDELTRYRMRVLAVVAVAVAVKTAMTANLILPLTDLNAVILPGMNMELIALL